MLSRAGLAVCLGIGLGSFAFGDIVTLDFPGAGSTAALGINDAGQIVGQYVMPCPPFPASCPVGAFLDSGGAFSTINPPASTGYLEPLGINNAGQIVGDNGHDPVLDTNGVFSTLPIPGTQGGKASAINNQGDIVGWYVDPSFNLSAFMYSGGVASTINGLSAAWGINDNGQIVGTVGPDEGVLYSGGAFYPISVPNSFFTVPQGINDAGEIVGWYDDQSGIHGFSDINGVYSSFDVPGATQTYAYGVNNSGQIVGYYVDANGVDHGFLDTPVPEPSSIVLLASATGLFAFVRFRRKRRTV